MRIRRTTTRAAAVTATVLALALGVPAAATADTAATSAAGEPEVTNWGTVGTNKPVQVIYGLNDDIVTLGNREHHAGHHVKSAYPMKVLDGGSKVCWRANTYVPLKGKDMDVGVYTVKNC